MYVDVQDTEKLQSKEQFLIASPTKVLKSSTV